MRAHPAAACSCHTMSTDLIVSVQERQTIVVLVPRGVVWRVAAATASRAPAVAVRAVLALFLFFCCCSGCSRSRSRSRSRLLHAPSAFHDLLDLPADIQ